MYALRKSLFAGTRSCGAAASAGDGVHREMIPEESLTLAGIGHSWEVTSFFAPLFWLALRLALVYLLLGRLLLALLALQLAKLRGQGMPSVIAAWSP